MCEAHSKVSHIKQQKYFHHLKGCGYNTYSPYYIYGPGGDENIFAVLCASLCYGPYKRCYKTAVFYIYIYSFSSKFSL